jgi:hypothetical protein
VVELGDTLRSGRSARKGMGVQIPPSALFLYLIWLRMCLFDIRIGIAWELDNKEIGFVFT